MSDQPLPRNETVSAYLDNEATPLEVAEIEQDETLLARAAQLRAVRDMVAAPVSPLPAPRREDTIAAALAAADANDDARRETRVVPLRRDPRALIAVAAAAVALAAVASAGLIAGRSGSDNADTTTVAASSVDPADNAASAPQAADEAPAFEADTASAATTGTDTADEAPAFEADTADEAMAEADTASEDTELAVAPTTSNASAPESPDSTDGAERESTIDATAAAGATTEARAVHLGPLDDTESLAAAVSAHWSSDDPHGAASTEPGACSAVLQDHVLDLGAEALRTFVATIGPAEPMIVDAELARREDGSLFVSYAARPGCEVGVQDLDALPDP